MALDANRSVEQMIADLNAMTQSTKEGRASRPRLSLPDVPVGSGQVDQEVLDKYLNAKSPVTNFLGNTLNTVSAAGNYLTDVTAQYGDFARWSDPSMSFLEKAAFNPFSHANTVLAEGWKNDGFFGAVGNLAEKGATGGDVIANTSSALAYDINQLLSPEDQAKNRELALRMKENFKEENPISYYGGGLGYSVVTDPLNMLTFGGASAVKAGTQAALKEANAVAKSAGVTGKFKTVEDAADAVYSKTIDKYSKLKQALPSEAKVLQQTAKETAKKNAEAEVNRIMQAAIKRGIDPAKAKTLAKQAVDISEQPAQTVNRIEKLASKARQEALTQINNVAKAARAKAQNRLLSLDIPLTNKTVPLLNKPAFMAKTADKAGAQAVDVVANLTEQLQPLRQTRYVVNPTTNATESITEVVKTAKDRMQDLLQSRYGVTKAEDLTIDALRDLQETFAKNIKQSKPIGLDVEKAKPKLVDGVAEQVSYKSPKIDDVLANADPRAVEIVRNLLGKDVDPKQIPQIIGDNRTLLNIDNATLNILPDLIRQEAKALGKDVVIPTPKPVPASLVNKFDQLFETSKQLSAKMEPKETPAIKQKTTNPSNIVTPEKKAYLAELRKNLQPTGVPQVIKGIDKVLVKQLQEIAKRLEKQVPTATVSKVSLTDALGNVRKINTAVDKVKMKVVGDKIVYSQTPSKYVPFEQLRKMPAFVQDMGGRTPIGRWYQSTLLNRLFNARSLGTGNAFIDSYGDLIQQAKTMKSGELNYMQRDLIKLSKIAEGLSEEELRAAQYLTENRFPKSYSEAEIKTFEQNGKLKEFVNVTKNLMSYIGKEEQTAGILSKLREDYFPHVKKFDENQWEEFVKRYKNDKDLAGLIGKSEANGFNKQRVGLPTLAELDDALVELQTKLGNATSPRNIEGLQQKINQLEGLFERDTMQALASRAYTSARSRAMTQLYNQMRKDRLLRYTQPSRRPKDYVMVTEDEARKLGIPSRQGSGYLYIHKDVMDALSRVEDLFANDNLNKAIKSIDDITRLWRLSTTVLIPKHYVNNLIGNVFNNALAGVDPAEYKNAAKILSDMRKEKLSSADTELVKEAYRNGIIGQGHNAEFEFFSNPDKVKSWAEKTNDKVRSWRYTKALMYAGQWVDDVSRLALYMDALKKTRSPKIAANRVREYLFNYHEVTQADKVVRSVLMPFWLWTKNNLPLQMKNLFTNPRVYAITENMRRATFDEKDFSDDPDFVREKYIQNFLGQKVPFSLPMYDVNRIDGLQGTLKNFASDLNPLIKVVPELALNKEFFTGAAIDKNANRRGSDGYDPAKVAQYLTKALGGQIGGTAVDTYKKVVEEDKLPLGEQLGRVFSSYAYGMPYYEK